ncbi:MAG: MFS transporter [Kiritimatiellia bacterium]|nr:MFS transporter [Kiritimatiellia bacterium]
MTILIYLFPAFMDVLVAQVIFVNGVRLAQRHCPDWVIAGIWTGWCLPYLGATLLSGKILTEHNASRILWATCALATITCGLFPFVESVVGIYVLTGICAFSAGLFFPAFQSFMKSVDGRSRKSVAWSTGAYTFAWSAGFAMGPLLAGFMMEAGPGGWRYSYALSGLLSLATGIGVWKLRHHGKPDLPRPDHPDGEDRPAAPAGAPDLAWLGWVSALGALSVAAILRSLFPALAEKELAMPESRQGLILFVFSMTQALTGLSLCRSRTWMYRPGAVFLFGLVGVAGTLGFAFARTLFLLSLAATACGVYTGSFYFYFVYHALVHKTRSAKYVSLNESVVGISGIFAPLAAGILSTAAGSYTQAYSYSAILLAGTVLFQMVIHKRNPIRPT